MTLTINKFFEEYIADTCKKHKVCYAEYQKVKSDSLEVRAHVLYSIYRTLTSDKPPVPLEEFYKVAKQYLYYDKYICKHGVEFYYYVKINNIDPVLMRMVEAYKPMYLDDVEYKMEAISR